MGLYPCVAVVVSTNQRPQLGTESERTMESEREQLLYGDRCMHGTNIGTPMGADFMCQYCEDGLTEWVEEPHYVLLFSADPIAVPVKIAEWWHSNIADKWEQLVAQDWRDLWCHPDTLAINPVFEVKQDRSGYWEYPDAA